MRSKPHFHFRHAHPHTHDQRFMRFEHHAGRHGHSGRRSRLLEHGDLRLLVLHFVAQTPRHGYELIKAIEDLTGGAYAPSPGVIYPTLTLLEELGHVSGASEGTKRLFTITESGRTALQAARPSLEQMLARLAQGPSREEIMPVKRAMENLRMALRMKLSGHENPETFRKVTDMIDDLVRRIEGV